MYVHEGQSVLIEEGGGAMTIDIIVHKNPDGSPNGTATIRAVNPIGCIASAVAGRSEVEFTEPLAHVASALGLGLEEIRKAKANEDPGG